MKLFNLKFDAKKTAALAILAGMLSGCGLQRQGQYEGTEVASLDGVSSQSQLILTIEEHDNQRVTGTWSTGRGSTQLTTGTFRGIINGNEIQKVYLSKTAASSSSPITSGLTSFSGVSTYSYISTAGVVCVGDYQGTLSFDGGSLTGTLEPMSTVMGRPCASLTVDADQVD
jgi:hypothetical protein